MSLLKENCPREQNIPECIRAILEAPVAWVKLPPLPMFLPPPGWDALVERWERPDGVFYTLTARGAEALGVHLIELTAEERAVFREESIGDVAWDFPTYDRERDVVFVPAGCETLCRWANVGHEGPEPRQAPERMPAAYLRRIQGAAGNLRLAREGEVVRRARVKPSKAAEARMAAIRAV